MSAPWSNVTDGRWPSRWFEAVTQTGAVIALTELPRVGWSVFSDASSDEYVMVSFGDDKAETLLYADQQAEYCEGWADT